MSMEINQAYTGYTSAYVKEPTKNKTEESSMEAASSAKQTTREYISGLEKKYGVQITVGKNTTSKSFMNYMLGSRGGNNVYIDSKIADKMASDPAYAEKYESVIAKAPEEGEQAKKEIEAGGNTKMLACGTQIHGDGKVTYWGVSLYTGPQRRMGTELREKAQASLEKIRKAKKEETEAQEKLEKKRSQDSDVQEKLREKTVEQAQSREELVEKLKMNSEDIRMAAIKENGKGEQIDLSI